MKLTEMSDVALDAERRNTDEQILLLKQKHADEEGPLLAALRVRRAQLIAELARRPVMLQAA